MKETTRKYLFYLSAVSLLVIMLLASRSAGISCDEIIHYNHSVEVYNYFSSHGADKSVLDTPVSYLKYYGQSYDNIVTILTKWLKIEDVYTFRNMASALMGWMAIFITALFAIRLKNYSAGFMVLFLFALSPAFMGHSWNNLKDIPFAFAYIAGIFFIFRFITKSGKVSIRNSVLLTLSLAFCISIRAGGLILICYLFFFFPLYYFFKYRQKGRINSREIIRKLAWMAAMSLVAFLLSAVLWPYALQDPFRNIFDSYKVMAHYPATFRQIFEGKVEWSDFMPWYYLLKSMAITIPVVILSGIVVFILFFRKTVKSSDSLLLLFLAFTVFFPLLFVILEKANLYSSWRQFLFVYPGIIMMASIGFASMFESIKKPLLLWLSMAIIGILSVSPFSFMIRNHPYEYIYYNEFTGGLKGAYGNYETDYYYTSQTEASKWLINYLEEKNIKGNIKVQATYTVGWLFREHPEIETSYFRYEERSMHDWDYAIVANRYITPFMLKNNEWPPANAIHIIYADSLPIGAVLERKTKDDLHGYEAFTEGRIKEAVNYFDEAIRADDGDEMIFYNFACALYRDGQYQKADSVLKKALEINPDFELPLMYLGNIAKTYGQKGEAIKYYERVIGINRKYFEAYVELADLLGEDDIQRARSLLRTCLTINPKYKPAIIALGNTYKESDPDVAEKYFEQAENIK